MVAKWGGQGAVKPGSCEGAQATASGCHPLATPVRWSQFRPEPHREVPRGGVARAGTLAASRVLFPITRGRSLGLGHASRSLCAVLRLIGRECLLSSRGNPVGDATAKHGGGYFRARRGRLDLRLGRWQHRDHRVARCDLVGGWPPG